MKNNLFLALVVSIIFIFQLAKPIHGHAKGHGEDCVPGDTAHYCDPALNLDCINSKCECKNGFAVNSTKVCEGIVGTGCGGDTNVTCFTEGFLTCNPSDLKCQCPKPEEQIFDTVLKACAQPLNTDCPMQPGTVPGCVSNAYCEMEGTGNQMKHYCKCNSGFIPANDNKTCASTGGSSKTVLSNVNLFLAIVAVIMYSVAF